MLENRNFLAQFARRKTAQLCASHFAKLCNAFRMLNGINEAFSLIWLVWVCYLCHTFAVLGHNEYEKYEQDQFCVVAVSYIYVLPF